MTFIHPIQDSRRNAFCILLVVATSALAYGGNVNFSANSNFDMVIEDSAGALLRQASLAQLGFFNLSDGQIQALALPTPANLAALDAAFTPFGSTRVGVGGSGPGGFTAGLSGTEALAGKQMFYWVLKSTDDTMGTAVSVSTAFEQAIFYRDKGIDADWTFPANLQVAPTVDASDLRGPGGSIASGAVVLAGSYVVNSVEGAAYNGQSTSAIQLVAVPEPSAFSLVGVAALALLSARRRRHPK